jgi:hypothetical protein
VYYGSTGTMVLRLGLGAIAANRTFLFGPAGNDWLPVAGDWTNSGKDSVGLFDSTSSTFYLLNRTVGGPADRTIQFGAPNQGSLAVAGRWPGSPFSFSSIGIVTPTMSFKLKYALSGGGADTSFGLSNPSTDYELATKTASQVSGSTAPLPCCCAAVKIRTSIDAHAQMRGQRSSL